MMESEEIRNRDIIVIGIQAWGIEIGSNCKNIAAEFSKHNRVLYVDPPIARVSTWTERHTTKIRRFQNVRKGKEEALVTLNDSMWNLLPASPIESINWIKNTSVFDFLNRMNAKRYFKDIQTAIEQLKFKDFLVFNDSSMFLGQYVQEMLQPEMYVYYMRDYLTKNPYWMKQGVRLEPQLIQSADLVVNNSTLYAEYGRQFNKHSYMVGQGCDTSLFDDSAKAIPVAEELVGIKKPIVGYVGYLSSRRLSTEILLYIAKQRPTWSVVLVGPEDEVFASSELHHLPNVHFLGSKPPETLPSYIKGFTVAMNPQLVNNATIGNYPRKIDEYLTMGKPTVATHTKAMEYFSDHTYLAKSKEEYIIEIEKAVVEDGQEKREQRIACGKSHSWENNVKEIYKYINRVKKEW